MTDHQHNHNYGLGKLLSQVFWGGVIIMALWVLVVFLFTFPNIVVISAIILAVGLIIAALISDRKYTRR